MPKAAHNTVEYARQTLRNALGMNAPAGVEAMSYADIVRVFNTRFLESVEEARKLTEERDSLRREIVRMEKSGIDVAEVARLIELGQQAEKFAHEVQSYV